MKKVIAVVVWMLVVPVLAQAKSSGKEVTGTLNLNNATEKQLELLPGIGPKVAEQIVARRAQKPFEKPADIRHVKGVGKATFAKIKDHLSVSGPTTLIAEGGKPASAEKSKASKAPRQGRAPPEMEE